jgi:hypothetical protein
VLSELEGKLVALVGDAFKGRAEVAVVEATGKTAPAAPGAGLVRVGLSTLEPEASFLPGEQAISTGNGGAKRRRVLALRFTATLELSRQPADTTAGATVAARKLLLDDMATAGHALADPLVRTGAAFAAQGPDQGFGVRGLELVTGTVAAEPVAGLVAGTLAYSGQADIWPVGVAEDAGLIAVVDPVALALPLEINADDPVVAVGGGTTIRIRGAAANRLAGPGAQTRVPQRLAVQVHSDLPPAERGAILSGDPGTEPGVRIVPAADPETAIVYRAPTGPIGTTRVERVAVHLATAAGASGLLLGSAAVPLRPVTP